MFIETKVWVSDYGYDQTLHAFEKATGKLGVDTLDLLILHQPVPHRFDTTVAAYKALETLLADGKVRAIGVSNFMPHHLDRLLRARPTSSPRSTRSSCTRTSRSPTCSAPTRRTGSSLRRGRRSAASPSTPARGATNGAA